MKTTFRVHVLQSLRRRFQTRTFSFQLAATLSVPSYYFLMVFFSAFLHLALNLQLWNTQIGHIVVRFVYKYIFLFALFLPTLLQPTTKVNY